MSSTVMPRPSQPAAGPADLQPMEQIYRMHLAENRRRADGFSGWLNEQELLVMPVVLPDASMLQTNHRESRSVSKTGDACIGVPLAAL